MTRRHKTGWSLVAAAVGANKTQQRAARKRQVAYGTKRGKAVFGSRTKRRGGWFA